MAEVKWIKLTTDMFDNRKIKHLRRLPDGDSIVLIWVMLLTMAGRCNAGGMIFLTENIPYTHKMLADELDFEESTVVLALNALEDLDMVVKSNGHFTIAGWDEYQNIEGMEKIRESKRLAQARWRAKKSTVDTTVDSTRYLVDGADKEEDKEIDIEEENIIKAKTTKFIPPTVEEVSDYCFERGNNVDAEQFVDFYSAKGWMLGKNKMKDWKAAVRTWERKDKENTVVQKSSYTDSIKNRVKDVDSW